MAFFSSIVKSSLSLLSNSSSSFGYSLGDKVEFFSDQSLWTLHRGTKKEDGSEVSIFVFDCTKSKDRAPLARNAFKRLRTMRHPDILRYLDGVETDQSIMFVTEPVEPLSSQLNQNPDSNLILWGLYKIANAIKFLNHDCDMVHGNVRASSVFTNKAGEWKLGGFELLCSMKEESPIILTFGGLVSDAQRYASPEVRKSGWTVIKELPSGALDAYHLGCLIYEAYNHRFDTADQLLSQKGSIPLPMQRTYAALLHPSVRSRASADQFLDEGLQPKGFFSTDFVKVNLFLENISIKEPSEKEVFFRKLDSFIDTFPSEFAKYKILPELIKAFEFGSGGAKALSAIVKVGEHLTTEEYQSIVIAPIVRMFASPDRAIRVSLLDNMPKFIGHMNNKMVTNQIFPSIATGFTDTIPIIREQTIKSILLIVPKLNDRVINYDLLKYLAKLQMDPEPGIRTNTTICLGKIAKYLNDSTRKKVLVPAFTRSLRDGFHHARVAALMALNATSGYYDSQECACRIVPAISTTLIDKEKIVRDQAFKVMQSFIQRIQTFADKMPETAIVEQSNTPSESNMNQDSAGMAGIFGGATKGLTDWAVSSLQSRFVTPTGEISNPVQTTETTTIKTVHSGNEQIHSLQVSMKSIEVDLNDDDANAWDDEDSAPLDFTQPTDDTNHNNGWDDFDENQSTSSFSKPILSTNQSPLSAVSSFGLASTGKAPSPMKLGHKPKTVGINQNDADMVQVSTGSQIGKEDKKAELERRREERRQRMAELREKKKSGIGAKKIENIGL
ncbi:putative inactive serine/threonine-protein kinase scy1 [Choanephora cucurbitarum]|uniref:Putative inactive serine/threonine-protein kinase scy1 n=1 Tax=Choanephora cucurbitarum TaxID=101091 RepID=A0A1C7N2P3_9FUNG|nr:putative inactive serine/threonine-protein kinase scy1 [Choanephora cucurbitarum]